MAEEMKASMFESVHQCEQCGYEALDNNTLNAHMRSKHGYFKCEQCDYQTHSQLRFKKHIYHIIDGRFTCDQCDHSTFFLPQLVQHVKSKHEGVKYSCKSCDKTFSRPDNLKKHIQSRHENKTYLCELCAKPFGDTSNLRKHKLLNHSEHVLDIGVKRSDALEKGFKCEQCNFRCKTEVPFQNHMISKHSNHNCNVCAREFTSKLSFQKHVKTVHGIETSKKITKPPKLYPCDECDYKATLTALRKHKERSHGLEISPPKKANWSVQDECQCPHCSVIFESFSKLVNHVPRIHDPPLTCPLCPDKKFPGRKAWLNHLYRNHTVKDKKCTFCEYTTSRKDKLRKHMQQLHQIIKGNKLKGFKCKVEDFDSLHLKEGKNYDITGGNEAPDIKCKIEDNSDQYCSDIDDPKEISDRVNCPDVKIVQDGEASENLSVKKDEYESAIDLESILPGDFMSKLEEDKSIPNVNNHEDSLVNCQGVKTVQDHAFSDNISVNEAQFECRTDSEPVPKEDFISKFEDDENLSMKIERESEDGETDEEEAKFFDDEGEPNEWEHEDVDSIGDVAFSSYKNGFSDASGDSETIANLKATLKDPFILVKTENNANEKVTRKRKKANWAVTGKTVCPDCSKDFETFRLLVKHMRKMHSLPLRCPLCTDKSFSTKIDWYRHLTRIHTVKDKKCNLCEFKTSRLDKLKKHVQYLHENMREGRQQKSLCDVTTSSNNLKKEKVVELSTSDSYMCEICSKKFNRESGYKEHMNTHQGISFHCDKCLFKTSYHRNLLQHMRRHDEENQFVCDVCNKTFKRKDSYTEHLKYHDGTLYRCDQCSYTTPRERYLQEHMNLHTGTWFVCDVCSYKTHRKRDLNSHNCESTMKKKLTVFDPDGPSCMHCLKTFATIANLRRHNASVHEVNKSIFCSICSFSTSRKDKFVKHMRTKHTEPNTNNENLQNINRPLRNTINPQTDLRYNVPADTYNNSTKVDPLPVEQDGDESEDMTEEYPTAVDNISLGMLEALQTLEEGDAVENVQVDQEILLKDNEKRSDSPPLKTCYSDKSFMNDSKDNEDLERDTDDAEADSIHVEDEQKQHDTESNTVDSDGWKHSSVEDSPLTTLYPVIGRASCFESGNSVKVVEVEDKSVEVVKTAPPTVPVPAQVVREVEMSASLHGVLSSGEVEGRLRNCWPVVTRLTVRRLGLGANMTSLVIKVEVPLSHSFRNFFRDDRNWPEGFSRIQELQSALKTN